MNKFKGKNVLVTGVNGFVGFHVAKMLVHENANVVGLRRSTGKTYFSPLGKMYTGDVSDYRLMREIISENEIDIIFHFAAYSIVRISAKDPLNTFNTNVMGTVAILEAARNVGRCEKILVASSDKAYGDHDILPYKETHALQPKNTYDTSKACADMIAQTYAHNYGMPVIVTRSSNIYGPHDPNMSRIIPNTIIRLARGLNPQIRPQFQTMEREFIYVDDVVNAYRLLALSPTVTSGEFNIGGTDHVRVQYIIEKIGRLMGKNELFCEIIEDPTFKEIEKQYIDASKLRDATGWKPQVELDDGLKACVDYYSRLA